MTRFVELCAGTASVSTTHMCGKPTALVRYWGGKKMYAEGILRLLGVGSVDAYVLVDAGHPAEVLRVVQQNTDGVTSVLRSWVGAPANTLWSVLNQAPRSGEDVWDAAAWLVLQEGSALGKPVSVRDGRWVTSGPGRLSPTAVRKGFLGFFSVASLIKKVSVVGAALNKHDTTVVRQDATVAAEDVRRGDIVYMDPDYQNTSGYAFSLPRGRVVETALLCAERGAVVGVSEAGPVEDLVRAGWRAVQVQGHHWSHRSPHKVSQKQEWLTTNRGVL